MELTRPFAENGDRQDFAIETQGTGEMSLQQGFGPLYSQAPESGGLFIDRAKFNQLMYLTTKGVIDNKSTIDNFKGELDTPKLEFSIGDSGEDFSDLDECIKALKKQLASKCYFGSVSITIKKNVHFNKDNSLNVLSINIPLSIRGQSAENKAEIHFDNNVIFQKSLVNFQFIKFNWNNMATTHYGVITAENSNILIYNSEIARATQEGLYYFAKSNQSSYFSITSSKVNNVKNLILASTGGFANITNLTGTSIYNVSVNYGGFAYLFQNDSNARNNQAANTATSNGLIFK